MSIGGGRGTIVALGAIVLLLAGIVIGQNLERVRGAAGRGREGRASEPAPRGPPGPRRSAVEYWITPPAADSSRVGYAAWIVLEQGGPFVLESCRAPDYALPADPAAALPPALAQCEEILDGRISRLGDREIEVAHSRGQPKTFPYSLAPAEGEGGVALNLGGVAMLVPGSKNTLAERLQGLPSDAAKRDRYLRRLFLGDPGGRATR